MCGLHADDPQIGPERVAMMQRNRALGLRVSLFSLDKGETAPQYFQQQIGNLCGDCQMLIINLRDRNDVKELTQAISNRLRTLTGLASAA
jgi:hypothetical protein